MASLAIPLQRASDQAPADPKAHWVTPEEQLYRLALPIAEELVNKNRGKLGQLPIFPNNALERSIIECAARSILRRSDISQKRIPSLQDLAVEQLLDPSPLPSHLTTWYTAHSQLKSLPKKVPPLPRHIDQIMNSKCPIYGDQMQADGTYLKVKDTHFLSLVPEEFGTLNQFERDILKPYGEQEYLNQENPLQFRYFWDAARQEHANVAFPETQWVLMTKDVLPGSRNKNWAEQVALVDALSQKALVNYEVPTLQQSFAAITTDMVATGERRYQAGSNQNGNKYTYTRVKDTTQGYHLAVGGFAPSGVDVDCNYDFVFGPESIGVAALRKF